MANKTTFWKFIENNSIEIPIIQRDYAQGRLGKENLRKNFLGDLKKALDKEPPYKDGEMKLDFVYGSTEKGKLNPLDGQQRLTTLWLLHWYIALRAGELNEDNCAILRKFTYETRISSREFCLNLCIPKNFESFDGSNIVGFITKQTWFYSAWKQDPSIQSMLRMLGGTRIADKKGDDIIDGLEELFTCPSLCAFDGNKCAFIRSFKDYWKMLTEEALCPIVFYHLPLHDFGLSDDLYIKMNARGKQLTDFENFKADLIGYAPDIDHPNDKLLDVATAALIDNEWTDVFWKDASEKNVFKVDDTYFKFLRRYFFCRLIATTSRNVDDTQKMELYQDLYTDNKKYDGLKGYREVLTSGTIESLKNLFARWNNVKIAPYWEKSSFFAFIPEYNVKKTDSEGTPIVVEVTTINQKERAVFHAVCCYFEDNEIFDNEHFEQWMHFVWNIVENSNIDNESAMIGAIRLFEELRPQSGAILEFLASSKKIRSNFAAKQVEEERFKAHLLLGENQDKWKPLLHEAEGMGFFKGNIACLLRLDKKEFVEDIECFKTKLSHAKTYFNDKGISKEFALPLTKALIRIIHRWDQIKNQYIYDTSAEAWKQNILHNIDYEYYEEVHTLLTAKSLDMLDFVSIVDGENEWVKSANHIKNIFSETKFLDTPTDYGNIVKSESSWRLRWANGVLAFYPYNARQAYCFDWVENNYSFRRNRLLHHPNISVDEDNPKVEGIYWQWNVFFKYNGNSYQWDNLNNIYLLNQQEERIRRDSMHKNDKSNDDYFCIPMDELPDITQKGLLAKLTKLAKEAI